MSSSLLLRSIPYIAFVYIAWLCIASAPVYAADDAVEKDIHQLCKQNYGECLKALPQALQGEVEGSVNWFALKLYQIEMYFQLKTVDERIALIEPLLSMQRAPVKFRISIYIDYAKALYYKKDLAGAKLYADKASELLTYSSQVFYDPLKIIKLVNLQTYLVSIEDPHSKEADKQTQYQALYSRLKGLKQQHANRADGLFWLELEGNLGHLARHTGEYDQALSYFIEATEWAKSLKNNQQVGVCYRNSGYLAALLNRPEQAIAYYQSAHTYFDLAQDVSAANYALVKLAILLNAQGEGAKAKTTFSAIDKHQLRDAQLPEYQSLVDTFSG